MIFNKCLIYSIPKNISKGIKKLSNVITELHLFSTSSDGEQVNLNNYQEKVDKLFYAQYTKNIQASAAEILKRELYDMILISNDTTISTNTPLVFPSSMVSKSTLEVVILMEKSFDRVWIVVKMLISKTI